jgi:hypothetical protein
MLHPRRMRGTLGWLCTVARVPDRRCMEAKLSRRDLLSGTARLAAGAAISAPALRLVAAPTARAATASGGTGLTEAGYWAFIDPIAERLDHLWDGRDRCYGVGGEAESAINAALLTIHAIAALRGHRGSARADDRARVLAGRLCESPPWSERPHATRPDKMFHVGGWLASVRSPEAGMEKSVDPKVAEALACAWRARDVLGLDATAAQRMAALVQRCAHGPFFRYPNVRLNQINWNAELFAHAATMTGDSSLLRRDYYLHMRRFVAGVHRPWLADRRVRPVYGGSTNLGPGYRFNYLTTRPPGDAFNLDSAEYANITVHFLLWYAQARAAGMSPLPRADRELLTAWVERVLLGYWTHAGFLNWDSGLGLKRWQIGKTFAFAQQGLLAIARADDFHARPEMAGWAKHIFDRGMALYTSWADADGGGTLAPAWLHGVRAEIGGGDASKILFGARMAANAARAIDLGLGERDALEPPPFYAYDPDIGRLAVSTPSYSTAVLAANHGAVGYGGTELARLYDGDGRPVATIGGRPPAAFGVVVRDLANRTLLASQTARLQPSLADPPLRLLHAPRGTGRVVAHPRHAYAAPFRQLEARGTVAARDVRIVSRHRFRADHVETTWTVTSSGMARRSVDVLFPGWTGAARIDAILHDGSRVELGARPMSLAPVAWWHLHGERSGYVVVVADRTAMHGTARALATTPQRYEPRPGPTLALRLVRATRFRRRTLTARIAPARDAAEAGRVAAALGAVTGM